MLVKEQWHRDFLNVYSSLHGKFHKLKSFFTSCFAARAHRSPSRYFDNWPFRSFMHHMRMAHGLPNPWSMYMYKVWSIIWHLLHVHDLESEVNKSRQSFFCRHCLPKPNPWVFENTHRHNQIGLIVADSVVKYFVLEGLQTRQKGQYPFALFVCQADDNCINS